MSITPLEARLHLLWYNELHPEFEVTKYGFEDCLRWAPRPYTPTACSYFRNMTSSFNTMQRFLMKLAMRMPPTNVEAHTLQELYEQGRFMSDEDPRLAVFCLGRRSGKTHMLLRVAEVFTALNRVTLFTPTARQAMNLYPYISPGGRGTPVDIQGWNMLNCPGISTDILFFDEFGLMRNWSQSIGDMRFNHAVALSSYEGGRSRYRMVFPRWWSALVLQPSDQNCKST